MATKAKTKTPAKASNELKTFRVHVSKDRWMDVKAKNKAEAEKTGETLFLQHGDYSYENFPVITEVNELEHDE